MDGRPASASGPAGAVDVAGRPGIGLLERVLSRMDEPRGLPRASFALERWLADCRSRGLTGPALDVGCGRGDHIRRMRAAGPFHAVHGLDLADTPPGAGEDAYHAGTLESFAPEVAYDALWCSHVLEHTHTPGPFLAAVRRIVKPGGLVCIVVPPLKRWVTVGHVNLFNPGTLMLNLVRAGFDCREIRLRRKGYNIAAILPNRPCPPRSDFGLDPATSYRPFLPDGLVWRQNRRTGVWYFDGDIVRLNW